MLYHLGHQEQSEVIKEIVGFIRPGRISCNRNDNYCYPLQWALPP